jgi:hypothetical protein
MFGPYAAAEMPYRTALFLTGDDACGNGAPAMVSMRRRPPDTRFQ